jgi:hypothetical protein
MTTAVDTNVLIALWDSEAELSGAAQEALDEAAASGVLIVSAPVYCELNAAPGRSRGFVDSFLKETGIEVEWELDARIWRTAAEGFRGYAERRRKQRGPGPRRILADFLIGAHALHRAQQLLSLDEGIYRASFPGLRVRTF